MRRLLTIKGVILLAAVAALLVVSGLYANHRFFEVYLNASANLVVSGDAIQIFSGDSVTPVESGDSLDFGTTAVDFFGRGPVPVRGPFIIKNLSNGPVRVEITGDMRDGVVPLFGPSTTDLKPAPDNAFTLAAPGITGDTLMGYLGLKFGDLEAGQKSTTIIFRATEKEDAASTPTHEVVVPNAQTNVEGNINNCFPFTNCTENRRYQQVYSSEDIDGSGIVHMIAFRPDVTSGVPFTADGVSLEIRLSHTTRSPDGLSSVFADNVGADETVVLDTTNLTLSSAKANCGEAGPCDFDIVIDLNDAFRFNGTDNLLLDVRMRIGASDAGFFDAHNANGDSVSRVFAGLTSTSGSTDSLGLVTKFFFKDFVQSTSAVSSPADSTAIPDTGGPPPEGSSQ